MSKKQYSFLECLTDIEKTNLIKGCPPLNHFAIFNNAIDHNRIQIINDGDEKFTDKLFFELLAEEPAYLGTVLFQNKIEEWRDICQWSELYKDKKVVSAARANLQKIGRVLARSGLKAGSPEKLPIHGIRIEYNKTLEFLKEFFKNAGHKPSSNLVVSVHPEWKQAFKTERGNSSLWSIKEITLRLTLFRLSSRDKNPIKISLKRLRQITR